MSSGGFRVKAGRPKASRTIEKEHVRDYIAQQVALHAPLIVNALLEKSLEGDVAAIKELFDRGFGKAIQGVELSGKDGQELFKRATPELIALSKEYDAKLKEKYAST